MTISSAYVSPDVCLVEQVASLRGWNPKIIKSYKDFKEDIIKVDDKSMIFCVADGVTLTIKEGEEYPLPSLSSEVANIFCEKAVEYLSLGKDLVDSFKSANKFIKEFNLSKGITPENNNKYDIDYYGCSVALGHIKGDRLVYGTIADSRVAQFYKNGKMKFITKDGWQNFTENLPDFYNSLDGIEQHKYRMGKRNSDKIDGKLQGYGVMTGEDGFINYLEAGELLFNEGDFFALFSDGITPYIEQEDFISLIKNSDISNFNEEVNKYVKDYINKNKPTENDFKFLYEFASEGSIVVVML